MTRLCVNVVLFPRADNKKMRKQGIIGVGIMSENTSEITN